MKILFIGDIVAKAGRSAVKEILPDLIKKEKIDLVVANVENLAHGKGVTAGTVEEIREAGVNIMTSGNHIWFREDFIEVLNTDPTILRPANYPADTPGFGFTYAKAARQKVLVINLLGRQWMNAPTDEPYRVIDAILLD
jgi:hypothetical protein